MLSHSCDKCAALAPFSFFYRDPCHQDLSEPVFDYVLQLHLDSNAINSLSQCIHALSSGVLLLTALALAMLAMRVNVDDVTLLIHF